MGCTGEPALILDSHCEVGAGGAAHRRCIHMISLGAHIWLSDARSHSFWVRVENIEALPKMLCGPLTRLPPIIRRPKIQRVTQLLVINREKRAPTLMNNFRCTRILICIGCRSLLSVIVP